MIFQSFLSSSSTSKSLLSSSSSSLSFLLSSKKAATYSSLLSSITSTTKTKITKTHTENRILNTHPLHLFRIIQDVDKYSEFIPMCEYSKVLRANNDGRTFEGELIVGKQPIWSEQYISKVTVIPEELTIYAISIESTQFDSLKSCWKLKPIIDDDDDDNDMDDDTTTSNSSNHHRCDVHFQVELTVSNPIIVSVLDQVLMEVATHQVTAFDQRCKELPIPYDLIDIANKYY